MNEFNNYKLGQLGKIITGKTPKTHIIENYGEDYMFIGPTDLHKHFIINNSERHISEVGFKSIKNNTIEGLSILVGCIGWDLGNVALVNCKCATNQQINSITEIKEEFNPYYIYYWIKGKKEFLYKISNVTRTPMLNKSDFSNIIIQIPSLSTQNQVAKVLSDLDAKIEVNNKINAELEAMAKTLYDYWFVQFDFPDANGKPYKSSGGKMVYNKELKREIPEGWETHNLGDLGDFKNGVNYDPSKPGQIPCPIINVRNISASSYFLKNDDLDIIYLNESDVRKYAVHENSIIIARSGIPGATRLIADIKKNTLYCGFAIHYQLKDMNIKFPVFFYLKSIEQIVNQGSGGTILKNVNQATLNGLKVTFPISKSIVVSFNNRINPIFKKINLIQKENQKLSELRDWLLPMLMNGQVTVGEAKEQLGMVAEPEAVYEASTIDELFSELNFDFEIAAIVLLTKNHLGKSYGKKYIHKMFSNIEFLNTLPKYKEVPFIENGWGMFSPAIAKAIDNQKYICFDKTNSNYEVITCNLKHIKEVANWINNEENKEFVAQVEAMLTIYEKPLINKTMDRIELFNTVLQCIKVLETDSFDAIWNKMQHWKMMEEGYNTKADKFTPEETRLMIDLINGVR